MIGDFLLWWTLLSKSFGINAVFGFDKNGLQIFQITAITRSRAITRLLTPKCLPES